MRKLACTAFVAASLTTTAFAGNLPGQYIVVVQDDGPGRSAAEVAASHGVAPDNIWRYALRGFGATLSGPQYDRLRRDDRVRFISPVREVRATATCPAAQQVPTGVARCGATGNPVANIDGQDDRVDVDVAVVDTGIDLDHPDLNVVAGKNCRRLRAGDCTAGGDDGHGHGTHVAGTIGAKDDGWGVVGVAPGARLYAVQVLDQSGSGTTQTVINGLEWVTRNADVVDVANLSLGGDCADFFGRPVPCDDLPCDQTQDAEHLAICNVVQAGVTVVVAAGNSRRDARYESPAAYDEVITVSALADFDGREGRLGSGSFAFSSCTESLDDSLACFSNYGADVDILAPGVGILSSAPGGLCASKSGTSMAAPHVAGAVALDVAVNGRNRDADPAVDAADVAAIKAALLTSSPAYTCGPLPVGICEDDPDGVQEPALDVAMHCTVDAECDDGNPCNGAETCNGACAPGTPVECDDGDACTTDACDPAGPTCGHTPIPGCGQCGAARTFCDANADCCSGSCNLKKKLCR